MSYISWTPMLNHHLLTHLLIQKYRHTEAHTGTHTVIHSHAQSLHVLSDNYYGIESQHTYTHARTRTHTHAHAHTHTRTHEDRQVERERVNANYCRASEWHFPLCTVGPQLADTCVKRPLHYTGHPMLVCQLCRWGTKDVREFVSSVRKIIS